MDAVHPESGVALHAIGHFDAGIGVRLAVMPVLHYIVPGGGDDVVHCVTSQFSAMRYLPEGITRPSNFQHWTAMLRSPALHGHISHAEGVLRFRHYGVGVGGTLEFLNRKIQLEGIEVENSGHDMTASNAQNTLDDRIRHI